MAQNKFDHTLTPITPITQNNCTPSPGAQDRVVDANVQDLDNIQEHMPPVRQTKIKVKIKSKEQPVDYDKVI